jgi:hypothetical protein
MDSTFIGKPSQGVLLKGFGERFEVEVVVANSLPWRWPDAFGMSGEEDEVAEQPRTTTAAKKAGSDPLYSILTSVQHP